MNENLSYSERTEWAQMLFTRHDKSIKDIAATVNTDEATVRGWIAEGGWEGIRRSLLTSKATQLEHLYNLLDALNAKLRNAEEPTTKDVDMMLKYTGTIRNLETETTASEIIEVSELFILWLRRRDLNLARKLIVHFDAFVKQRLAA